MTRRSSWHARRCERYALMRSMLIQRLGGVCYACPATRGLEPDHVRGCTWRHSSIGSLTRLQRYADEYRRGVELRAACRSHNGRLNQHTHGTRKTRAQVIDEIEAAERAA